MLVRNAWYIAAWADELKDAPVARRICNEPLVLFRDASGRAAALADRCCHRAAPLPRGELVGAGIQCGYHGLAFDGAARCVAIPGQKLSRRCAGAQLSGRRKKPARLDMDGRCGACRSAKIVDFPFHNDAAKWPNKHDSIRSRPITC